MTPHTEATRRSAERFAAIECTVVDHWADAYVEAVTDAATMFISTSRASVIITMGLTTSGGHDVLIRRFDEPGQPTEMRIEGTAVDVANEVAEALADHFGSLSQAVS